MPDTQTTAHLQHRLEDLERELAQVLAHWDARKAQLEALGRHTAHRVEALTAQLAAVRGELTGGEAA